MTQTWALLLDSYRELSAKKLFWITLILSGLVVASFAMVGLTPQGLKIFIWDIPAQQFNSNLIPPATFYKLMFISLGAKFWLGWGASILALVSTAGIIPDFVAGGSIELTLSKPISRARLFLVKYASGLLFVALQVTVFTVAAFFVIGLRGGAWIPGLFWAIPIILLFFSYLYCICALAGLLTRSTIAALIITIILWLFFFSLNTTDSVFVKLRETSAARVQALETRIERLEKSARAGILDQRQQAGETSTEITPDELTARSPRLETERDRLVSERSSLATWTRTARIFYLIKTPLPKTSETLEMLNRALVRSTEMEKFIPQDQGGSPGFAGRDDLNVSDRQVTLRVEEILHARPLWWVLGTSVAFEVVVLGAATLVFRRRDF